MTQTIELVGFIPHSGDDGRRSCFLVDTGVLLIEGFETGVVVLHEQPKTIVFDYE